MTCWTRIPFHTITHGCRTRPARQPPTRKSLLPSHKKRNPAESSGMLDFRRSRRRGPHHRRRISRPTLELSRRPARPANETSHPRGDFQPGRHRLHGPARDRSVRRNRWGWGSKRSAAAHFSNIHRKARSHGRKVIEENIRTLGVQDRTKWSSPSAFLWAKRDFRQAPQPINRGSSFAARPTRSTTSVRMKCSISSPHSERSRPAGQHSVVEAEVPFDFSVLTGEWDVRA